MSNLSKPFRMENLILKIAQDFSEVPAGRYRVDGDFTGEAFRDEHLIPALKKASPDHQLVIVLDGAEGYPSSFLEEAFGGLVRKWKFTEADLHRLLRIEAGDGYQLYAEIIWDHIKEADSQTAS